MRHLRRFRATKTYRGCIACSSEQVFLRRRGVNSCRPSLRHHVDGASCRGVPAVQTPLRVRLGRSTQVLDQPQSAGMFRNSQRSWRPMPFRRSGFPPPVVIPRDRLRAVLIAWHHVPMCRTLNIAASDVTRILRHIKDGDPSAPELLLPPLHDELPKLPAAWITATPRLLSSTIRVVRSGHGRASPGQSRRSTDDRRIDFLNGRRGNRIISLSAGDRDHVPGAPLHGFDSLDRATTAGQAS